ncbi:MAG: transporter substrate-binding domain-containing protein [Bacillaceae bacterium]|nr:transporter substrate-binding domain-containing protein [Bacillaceae bacterium]
MFYARLLMLLIWLSTPLLTSMPVAASDSGVYTIAYLEQFYPFQQKGEKGQAEGFVIDLLNAIATTENIKFQYQPMTLDEAVNALNNGEIDGIAGLKYTSEKDRFFDFSQPFTTVSHTLLVPENNTSIQTLPDLGGKVVAIERGDVALDILRDVRRVEVLVAKNQTNALKYLESGRADAFLGNSMLIETYLEKRGLTNEYRRTDDLLLPSDYAFATTEGNQDLIRTINRGLIKVKANQEYQKIYNQWFGWEDKRLAQKMRQVILMLVLALMAGVLYVIFSIRWNRKLKEEVAKRTVELERTNRMLEQKIEEEKNLRQKLIHKEKMQALGQLVASIAHELRNPLTSIKAFVELIPEKFESPRFRQEVSRYVPAEINRLNKLLTNLLDYAKPGDPQKQTFAVREWLDSVYPFFQIQFDKKHIRFSTDIPESLYVWADYGQMKQVLVNILLNAMDAVGQNGDIHMTACSEQDNVVIKIRDSGKGIPQDKMALIFEPFYTDKTHGTGLGLSLCRQYMKDNNGEIQIESVPGKGTTVVLRLPTGKGGV